MLFSLALMAASPSTFTQAQRAAIESAVGRELEGEPSSATFYWPPIIHPYIYCGWVYDAGAKLPGFERFQIYYQTDSRGRLKALAPFVGDVADRICAKYGYDGQPL